MLAAWHGAIGNASSGTVFAPIPANYASFWDLEDSSGGAMAVAPLTDACTVTSFHVKLNTAPGVGTSRTFTIRQNGGNTSAAVTISNTATEATWTGTVSLSASDLVCVQHTQSGSPTNAVGIFWTVDYDTGGGNNFWMMLSCCRNTTFSNGNTYYPSPQGGYNFGLSTTATDYEIVVPTDVTATKIAMHVCVAPTTGSSHVAVVRKNNTTDSSFSATISGPSGKTNVSSSGSLVFAPGDMMVLKMTPNSNWTGFAFCVRMEPANSGEIFHGYGTPQAPSTSATNYESPHGVGINGWNTTESSVYEMLAAGTLKKLYVKLTTATGSGTTRTFTVRSAIADTALVATLTNTATGNDTTHTYSQNEGDLVSIKMVPTSTPAATNGAKVSFVQVIPQPTTTPTNTFFAMFW